MGRITATWRKRARSELWRIRCEDYRTAPKSDRYNEERDHSLYQSVKRIARGMARADSRLGTWQVLLTISMVITPLSAHGKSTALPESHPVRVCMCACVCLCKKARTCVNRITPASACMIWKMTNTFVHARGMGMHLPFKMWALMVSVRSSFYYRH